MADDSDLAPRSLAASADDPIWSPPDALARRHRDFRHGDATDLEYFFDESDGALGPPSNYWIMIETAMGSRGGGGQPGQRTAAMLPTEGEHRSPVEKEARIREIVRQMRPDLARVLSKRYSGAGVSADARRLAMLPLTPTARRLAAEAGVVPQTYVDRLIATAAEAHAPPPEPVATDAAPAEGEARPKPKKAKKPPEPPHVARATAALRVMRTEADRLVVEAEAAYVEAKRSLVGTSPAHRPRGQDFLAYVRGA